jgi:hypothetical protein
VSLVELWGKIDNELLFPLLGVGLAPEESLFVGFEDKDSPILD